MKRLLCVMGLVAVLGGCGYRKLIERDSVAFNGLAASR